MGSLVAETVAEELSERAFSRNVHRRRCESRSLVAMPRQWVRRPSSSIGSSARHDGIAPIATSIELGAATRAAL